MPRPDSQAPIRGLARRCVRRCLAALGSGRIATMGVMFTATRRFDGLHGQAQTLGKEQDNIYKQERETGMRGDDD